MKANKEFKNNLDVIFRNNIPGGLSALSSLQSEYYARAWGFSFVYESVMTAGISEFLCRYDEQKDFVRTLVQNNTVVGGITIDHRDGITGKLRWFYIADHLRGTGVGKQIFSEAVAFIKAQGFERVYLTTFKGLNQARGLYEQAGFKLVEEKVASTWGKEVTEQRFDWHRR